MQVNLINKFKKVIFFSGALICAKLAVFLFNLYLATTLTSSQFGYISLYQSYVLVATLVFGFSLHSVFIRYFYTVKLKKIVLVLKPYYLILGMLSIGTSIVVFFSFDRGSGAYLIPVTGFLLSLIICFQAISRCQSNSLSFFMAALLKPLLLISFYFIFVYFSIDYVKAFNIGNFVAVLLLIVLLSRFKFLSDLSTNSSETIKVFQFVFPLVIMQFASLLNNAFDKFALDYFMEKSDLGIYSKGYLLGSILGMGIDIITLLWAPYVQKNKAVILKKLQSINVFIALCLAGSLLGIVFILMIIENTFYKVVFIITFSFVARMGYQIYIPVLTAFDKTKVVAKITIISGCITLVANLALIPLYGIVGAAISTFLSFFCISIWAYIELLKLE